MYQRRSSLIVQRVCLPVVLDVIGRHGWIGHPVIDDGVDADRHRVSGEHFLRGHVERDGPEVHLLEGVDARHDEEEPWPLGSTRSQATQSEHDGSLVLLNNLEETDKDFLLPFPVVIFLDFYLDGDAEGEGHGDED